MKKRCGEERAAHRINKKRVGIGGRSRQKHKKGRKEKRLKKEKGVTRREIGRGEEMLTPKAESKRHERIAAG